MQTADCKISLKMVFDYLTKEGHQHLTLDVFSRSKTRYFTLGHYRVLKKAKLDRSIQELNDKFNTEESQRLSYYGHGTNLTVLLFSLIATHGLLVPGLKLAKLTGFHIVKGKTSGESAGTSEVNQKYVSAMPINGATQTYYYSPCRTPDFKVEHRYAMQSCGANLGFDFKDFPSSRVPIIIIGIGNTSNMIEIYSMFTGECGFKLLKIIAVIVLNESDFSSVVELLCCLEFSILVTSWHRVLEYYKQHELNPKEYSEAKRQEFFKSFFDIFSKQNVQRSRDEELKREYKNLLSRYQQFIDTSILEYHDIEIVEIYLQEYIIIHNTICEAMGSGYQKSKLNVDKNSCSYQDIVVINEQIKRKTSKENIFYFSYLLLLQYNAYFLDKSERRSRRPFSIAPLSGIGNIPVNCILDIHSYSNSGFFKRTKLKINPSDSQSQIIEKVNLHISSNPHSRTSIIVENLKKIDWRNL